MKKLTPEMLDLLFEHAALEPPQNGRERLEPVIEKYMQSLEVLHSINLDDEEVAPCFQPASVRE